MLIKIPDYQDDPEPESGNGENGRPSPYLLIFLMFVSASAWYQAPQLEAIDTNVRIIITAACIAIFWTSLMGWFWLHFWPWLVAWFYAPQKTAAKPEPAPPPVEEEPKRAEQTAVQPGQTRIVIGNRLVNLTDYGIDPDHWQRVKLARHGGGLPDVSLPKLHALGIDRKQRASEGDSDAHRLIDMLLALNLVQDNGNNRPYSWTDAGVNTLPYPNSVRVH